MAVLASVGRDDVKARIGRKDAKTVAKAKAVAASQGTLLWGRFSQQSGGRFVSQPAGRSRVSRAINPQMDAKCEARSMSLPAAHR